MRSPLILVVRQPDQFSEYLKKGGCRVVNLALIRTEPVDDPTEFAEMLKGISEYAGVFITSPAAAEVFARQLEIGGAEFAGKIYVLGERARDVLDSRGLNVVFDPSANTAEDLISSFDPSEFAGKKLLFVRGDKSMRTIPLLLASSAQVEEVEVYRTIEDRPGDELMESVRIQLQRSEIDWICFFSPAGVRSFTRLFGNESAKYPAIAVIGETTAQTARSEGLTADLVSPRANAREFAKNLIEQIKNH
jgi:uroporphyrinogen-III synthase